jgi:diacylglycerol kinase family enzyme
MVHVPQGNENLFARSLGMGHRLEDSLALLESGEETLIDVGCVDGKAMLLMASIGLDAEIVSDVALNRGNQVSNLDYLRACLRNLHGRRPPQMTIVVDGEPVIAGQRGWVVVSNASEYGAQVNPAPMARLDDQLLDMTFFRASSGVEVFAWMARCRAGRQVGASGFVHRRSACSVVITTSEPTRWQLDGDPPPDGASPKTDRLSISIWNRGLPVLTCRQ